MKSEDDSTQIHLQEEFLPFNDGETIVKQEDHYDGDSNDGETIVKQKDHSDGDSKDGETIVKEERGKTIVKEENGETIVKEETGETRHWVVCDGGFLNEIKKHQAWSVETSADENERRVDNNISYGGVVCGSVTAGLCDASSVLAKQVVRSACMKHSWFQL